MTTAAPPQPPNPGAPIMLMTNARVKPAPPDVTHAARNWMHALLTDRVVCSAAWADDAVAAMVAGMAKAKPDTAALRRELNSRKVYPPGGSRTAMLACPACGRPCGATHHPDEVCVDCREDDAAPPDRPGRESPPILEDFHAAQIGGLDARLAAEEAKERDLRRAESDEQVAAEVAACRSGEWIGGNGRVGVVRCGRARRVVT